MKKLLLFIAPIAFACTIGIAQAHTVQTHNQTTTKAQSQQQAQQVQNLTEEAQLSPALSRKQILQEDYSDKVVDRNSTDPLLQLINITITQDHYSRYRLGGTYFNEARGVYIVDCSGYLDELLKKVEPQAFQQVAKFVHTERPNSLDYFKFIKHLPMYRADKHWYRVNTVSDLRPGDVLIFRYKDLHGRRADGHVMIILTKPEIYHHNPSEYIVRVADATPFPHSFDTRHGRRRGCGIGEGTMLLHVNVKTGRPDAYAWSINARFEHEMDYAMARPLA